MTERDTKYKTWLRPKLEKIRKESALFAVNFRASWADRRMEFVGKFPSLGGESLETGRFVSFLLLLLGPGLISWLAFESDYSSEINRGEYEGYVLVAGTCKDHSCAATSCPNLFTVLNVNMCWNV